MLKIIRFISANLGKLDALHVKITAAYNLWNTIYEAVKPLLPAAPGAVLPMAPAPVAPSTSGPAGLDVERPDYDADSEGTPVV